MSLRASGTSRASAADAATWRDALLDRTVVHAKLVCRSSHAVDQVWWLLEREKSLHVFLDELRHRICKRDERGDAHARIGHREHFLRTSNMLECILSHWTVFHQVFAPQIDAEQIQHVRVTLPL